MPPRTYGTMVLMHTVYLLAMLVMFISDQRLSSAQSQRNVAVRAFRNLVNFIKVLAYSLSCVLISLSFTACCCLFHVLWHEPVVTLVSYVIIIAWRCTFHVVARVDCVPVHVHCIRCMQIAISPCKTGAGAVGFRTPYSVHTTSEIINQ